MANSDPTKLKLTKNFGVPGIALCVARTQGSQLVYGSSDFKVYGVDCLAEKPEPQAFKGDGHQSYVTGVVRAGNSIVTGSYDGRLIWWNAETKEQVRSVEAHALWIRKVIATADGQFIISVADDMLAKVWKAETGDLVHTLADHKPLTPHDFPSMLFATAVSADGKWLATGDKVGHIAIWEMSTGKKVGELEAPGLYTWDPKQRRHSIGGIRSLAFSADSRLLAAGGIGHIGNIDHLDGPSRVEVFEWQASKKLFEVVDAKVKGLVEELAFDPNGKWLIGSGGDNSGFVSFYELEKGQVIHQDKAPMHVHQFVLNESSDALYAVGHGRVAVFEFKGVEAAPAA